MHMVCWEWGSVGLWSDLKSPIPLTSMDSYIFQAWLSLISGPAIDERRALLRIAQSRGLSTGKRVKESRARPAGESDEDFDPNDIVQESDTQSSENQSDTDYGSDYW